MLYTLYQNEPALKFPLPPQYSFLHLLTVFLGNIHNKGVGSVHNFWENSRKTTNLSSSNHVFNFYFGPFTSIMNECKSVKVLIWLNDHILKVINMQSIRIKERNLKFIRQ